MMTRIGQQFGRLTIQRVYAKDGIYWADCKCDCGEKATRRLGNIVSGGTRSCGCFNRERLSQTKTKHGAKKKGELLWPEYRVWAHMIQRCTNPNAVNWERYGGRGIRVCDRWRDFSKFLEDMGKRPGPKFTIERENNSGDYEPENCIWIDGYRQAQNKRNNRFLTLGSETYCVAEWARRIGIKQHTLAMRIRKGWTVKEALSMPTMTAEQSTEKARDVRYKK